MKQKKPIDKHTVKVIRKKLERAFMVSARAADRAKKEAIRTGDMMGAYEQDIYAGGFTIAAQMVDDLLHEFLDDEERKLNGHNG